MPSLNPLGSLFNIVGNATGQHILMTDAASYTLYLAASAGNQTVTLKESKDGTSEQALAVIDTIYKAPAAGGTWTKVTQTASDSYTHADGTNNATLITVYASQLSDTFNSIEFTTTNQLFAHGIIHGLKYPQDATRLPVPRAN